MTCSPPTMSRWTAARMRAATSGYFERYAIVPVISEGQMNRIVRTGGGIRLVSINACSVRAISELGGQPAGFAFPPGFLGSGWQLNTISPAAGSDPGIVAT